MGSEYISSDIEGKSRFASKIIHKVDVTERNRKLQNCTKAKVEEEEKHFRNLR